MRTLCHSSQPFLRGGKEMELETEFCEESETQTNPPPPKVSKPPLRGSLPLGYGTQRVPLLHGAVQPMGRGQLGLFLEISPIVLKSRTEAKSSSCNLRAARRKPPLNKQPHVDPAAP